MKFRGTIASDMSGKLGGVVASHNTYGTYFRRLVKPAQPRTQHQLAQRQSFASVSQAWRGLPAETQQLWINQAPQFKLVSKSGNPIVPTGQALWMWANVLRTRLGLARVDIPPQTTDIPAIHGLTIELASTTTVSVAFDATDEWHAAGGAMLLSISAPIQPGIRFNELYTPLGQIDGTAASPQTFTLPFTYAGGNLKLRASASTPDGRRSMVTTAWLFPVPTPIAANITGANSTGNPGDPIVLTLSGPTPFAGAIGLTNTVGGVDQLYSGFAAAGVSSISLTPNDPLAASEDGTPYVVNYQPAGVGGNLVGTVTVP